MKVAGIDPGTTRLGYACLESGVKTARLLHAETITIPPRRTSAERLGLIERAIAARLRRDRPEAVAVEKLYFAKNAKTAMAVAEARGVILLTASRLVPSIWEYAPLEVKLAVTSYGRSSKAELYRALRMLLARAKLPAGDDARDAIAIALTALVTRRPPTDPYF